MKDPDLVSGSKITHPLASGTYRLSLSVPNETSNENEKHQTSNDSTYNSDGSGSPVTGARFATPRC